MLSCGQHMCAGSPKCFRVHPEYRGQLKFYSYCNHSTVLQNLLVGRHTKRKASFLENMFFLPHVKQEEVDHREAVEQIIEFLDLQPYRNKMVAGLPYGVRKICEIGRALACGPKVLMLDEPASGLSVEETQDVDKVAAWDRVAADTDTARLTKPSIRRLFHGFVGERSGAGHDTDLTGQVDIARHDADLALAGRDHPRTVGTDHPRV